MRELCFHREIPLLQTTFGELDGEVDNEEELQILIELSEPAHLPSTLALYMHLPPENCIWQAEQNGLGYSKWACGPQKFFLNKRVSISER